MRARPSAGPCWKSSCQSNVQQAATVPVRSTYCRHAGQSRIVRTQTANGHWQVRRQCGVCKDLFGTALAHSPGWENLPLVASAYQNPPCEVCGALPTTNHHWFPRHIASGAGLSCDAWPQSYLCHKHHMEWHRLVTPGLVPEADKVKA